MQILEYWHFCIFPLNFRAVLEIILSSFFGLDVGRNTLILEMRKCMLKTPEPFWHMDPFTFKTRAACYIPPWWNSLYISLERNEIKGLCQFIYLFFHSVIIVIYRGLSCAKMLVWRTYISWNLLPIALHFLWNKWTYP